MGEWVSGRVKESAAVHLVLGLYMYASHIPSLIPFFCHHTLQSDVHLHVGRVPRILKNPLRTISSAAQNVIQHYSGSHAAFGFAYIAHQVKKFGLREYTISLLCRRTIFKVRQTCTIEGRNFQNLTGEHAPKTLLQINNPNQSFIFQIHIQLYAHCQLQQLCVCEEEET